MSDKLEVPLLFGDICEMCKCDIDCKSCAFDEGNIKSQAETIERLKKLVKAVKYDDSEGCWRAEWIIGETWQEYRDNLLKELEEGT